MGGKRARAAGSLAGSVPADAPELPTGKAFMVQLSRETGPTLEPFAGRVEHLATGRRARFASFEDFQAAMIRLLSEAKQRRSQDAQPGRRTAPGLMGDEGDQSLGADKPAPSAAVDGTDLPGRPTQWEP